MNFFRKLFGKKSRPEKSSPAQPAQMPSEPPELAAPDETPAGEPPRAVTAESVTPAPAERPVVGNFSATFADAKPVPDEVSKPVKLETTLLTIDGPVWLPGDSPALELFPAKPDDASAIAFIGGSAELPSAGFQMLNGRAPFALDPGALSRALPLYLADQVELGTDALTRTLVSWIVSPRPGFILGGKQWDDATAAHHARQTPADDPSDYVVLSHLVCTREQWQMKVRLVRTIDGACLATLSVDCDPLDPGATLPTLAKELLAALAQHADLPAQSSGFGAPHPTTELLARLDQLLVLRTASLPGGTHALRNVETLVAALDTFARTHGDNVPARLLFLNFLAAVAKIRPGQRLQLAARAESLQRDLPLPEPAHSVIARIVREMSAT